MYKRKIHFFFNIIRNLIIERKHTGNNVFNYTKILYKKKFFITIYIVFYVSQKI